MVPLLTELMDDSHVQIVKSVSLLCRRHQTSPPSSPSTPVPLLQYLDSVSSTSTVDAAERSLQAPVYREG